MKFFHRLSILGLMLAVIGGCSPALTNSPRPACMTAEQYFGQGAQGIDCTRTLTKDFPQETIVTCWVARQNSTLYRVKRLDRRCW